MPLVDVQEVVSELMAETVGVTHARVMEVLTRERAVFLVNLGEVSGFVLRIHPLGHIVSVYLGVRGRRVHGGISGPLLSHFNRLVEVAVLAQTLEYGVVACASLDPVAYGLGVDAPRS